MLIDKNASEKGKWVLTMKNKGNQIHLLKSELNLLQISINHRSKMS